MATITDVSNQLVELNETSISINDTLLEINNDTLDSINHNILQILDFLVGSDNESLEDRREQRRQNERMLAALEGRGGGSGGGRRTSASDDDEEGGGLLGGLAAGSGAGGAVVGFGRGMASLGLLAPKIVLGAGAIGTAIGLIGAGIAGAAWLTGKAFPTFVEGLKSFEDVDGENLEQAGDGVKSLGIGIAAWGGGQIAAGVGNLVSGVLGDGMDDMMNQLEIFGQAEIDVENVKRNSEAMAAYGKAMAAAGAGTAAGGIGTFVEGVAGGLGKLFGGDDPLDSLQEFGSVRVNSENIKNNADAMTAFAKATAVGAAGVSAGGIGTFVSGVLGGIGEAFGGEQSDPLSQLKLFGETAVNKDNVKNNAEAMKAFSGAIALGGAAIAPAGLGTFVNGVMGGIGEFFGGQSSDPIGELMRFGERRVDRDTVENNAAAMKAFGSAMPSGGLATASAGFGTYVNGVMGGIGRFFGGEQADPLGQLMKFGERAVNKEVVKNNAEAMKAFGSAMAIGGIGTTSGGIGTFIDGIAGGLGKLFGGDDPLEQLQKFSEARINRENVEKNAASLRSFGDAMAGIESVDVSEALGTLAGNMGVAIPLLDALANGGVYNPPGIDVPFFGDKVSFGEGILDPSLNMDQVAEKVQKARSVFSDEATDEGISEISTERRPSGQLSAAAEERRTLEEQTPSGGNGGVNVQSNTSNNVTNNSQTVVKPVEGPTRPPRTARDTQFAPAP